MSIKHLPRLCVASKAPADTEVTKKILSRSPRKPSHCVAAFLIIMADVFLSWYLQNIVVIRSALIC